MVLTVLNLHIIALFRQGSRYKLRTVEIVKRVSDSKTIPRGDTRSCFSKALTSLFPRCKTSFLITTSSALNNISFVPPYYFLSHFLGLLLLYHNRNIKSIFPSKVKSPNTVVFIGIGRTFYLYIIFFFFFLLYVVCKYL